jgi:hypothetical protein
LSGSSVASRSAIRRCADADRDDSDGCGNRFMAVATVIGTLVTLCGQRRARQVPAKSSQNPACFGVCLVGAQSRTSVALDDRSSSSLSGALPRRHAGRGGRADLYADALRRRRRPGYRRVRPEQTHQPGGFHDHRRRLRVINSASLLSYFRLE